MKPAFCYRTWQAWQRVGHVFRQWRSYQPGNPPDRLRSHLHNAESGPRAPIDGEEPRKGYLPGVLDPQAAHSAVEGVLADLAMAPAVESRVRAELRAAASGDGYLQEAGGKDYELRDKAIRMVNRNWPM